MITRRYPYLKRSLRKAHINATPRQFVKRSLIFSLYIAAALTVLVFFFTAKTAGFKLLLIVPITFFVSFILVLVFLMQSPQGTMRKREREINKEVLFAGRYLLVKMESGTPLFNALIDASKAYGVSAKHFKEIVDDINTGMSIEDALDTAREYSTSTKFRKVLGQLVISLKTGTDVTGVLRSTLKSINAEQIIEIKAYAKKLNSIMLFYMVTACVAPSLGMTFFVILSSFMDLKLGWMHLGAVLFFLAVIQGFFIIIIKSSRPMVNL
ncbi:MAG: type II secretion system F family protein [bacterium]|nr:type II secretion system F family protein [bacterium]